MGWRSYDSPTKVVGPIVCAFSKSWVGMSAPIPNISIHARVPNRYTGGYDCSTVTDKLRWQTIASVKQSRISVNTNMGGETVVAKKVYPPCEATNIQ